MHTGKQQLSAVDYPHQSDASFETMNQIILTHLEERDWLGNPARGLAISIALEANELLEHYQWSDEPVGGKDAVAEELADILIYAFEFAQANDIDIFEAMKAKLAKAAKKYPAEAFKGRTGEERRAAWAEAKKNYKKEGIL